MIFVTVGTHEQPFNRLVKEIDALKGRGTIEEEVIIQLGFSTFQPKNCQWSKVIPFQDMNKYMESARIVITHGGPASFIAPLQIGKIPIVVPRQKHFDEHVNNHQLEFCKMVNERMHNIILIENIEDIGNAILEYNQLTAEMNSTIKNNNRIFNENIENIVWSLYKGKK